MDLIIWLIFVGAFGLLWLINRMTPSRGQRS